MKNWIIYDIEILKAIPTKSDVYTEGITYCEGWHDHANMGISVVGVYEYAADRYRVFCDDNKDELRQVLEQAERIIGFNNNAFDNQVLALNWSIEIPPEKSYDLLVEIWAAVGLGPQFNWRTHGGVGLDAMAQANLGEGKTGHGAIAPIDWQRGKIGAVIDYCLQDVRLTKRLIDLVGATQTLIHPTNHELLEIRSVQ